MCYRLDSVPIQFFASWRLGKLVGERFCYRIDNSAPKVFARSRPLGYLVEQSCYRMDSVPIQFFASWRLRKLVGIHMSYRIARSFPEVFARRCPA